MENILEGPLTRSQSSPNLHLYIEATEVGENDFVPEHQLGQVKRKAFYLLLKGVTFNLNRHDPSHNK